MQTRSVDDVEVLFFDDADEWRSWLASHHDSSAGIWMGLYKKHVPQRGLTWEQAVPVALCFGWIDSQLRRIDEDATRQRWTPRRKGSTWSRVNVEHVERLTAAGLMTPAGLAAFEARASERTGTYAYEQAEVDAGAEQAVLADPRAAAFWQAATASYRRICLHWVASAKQQATRERRASQLVDDCANGRLIPSQRPGREPAWLARARAAAAAASPEPLHTSPEPVEQTPEPLHTSPEPVEGTPDADPTRPA